MNDTDNQPSDEGLVEETAPSEVSEDAPAKPAPFVKRGIADLDAQAQNLAAPRPLSGDSVDEEKTAPGLRIPADQSAPVEIPPASVSGAFPVAKPDPAGTSQQYFTPPTGLPAAPRPHAQPQPQVSQTPAVPVQPPPAPKSSVRGFAATFVVAVIAFCVMAWAIVTQWMPPQNAIILTAIGMLIPTTAVALLMSIGSPRNPLVRAIPALLFSALGVAGAWTWTMDEVRAEAVGFAPDQIASMTKMIQDPSLELAVAGCVRYASHYEDAAWWSALFEALNTRPELATRCISQLPEAAQKRIGGALSDRWSRELAEKAMNLSEARACQMTDGIAKLPLPTPESSARLLRCNLSAPSAAVQKCCGRSLATLVGDPKEWAKQLDDVVKAVPSAPITSGIFTMALHGQGLTPEQVEFVDTVKFNGIEVQTAALSVACDEIPKKESDVLQHLSAAMDVHCNAKISELPKDRASWSQICETAVKELAAGDGLSPMSTLCSLTSKHGLPEAITAARRAVRKAQPVMAK